MRVGVGYDIHRFADDRRLILGGVEFEGERGLLGHSDADVVTHAIIDALLGAAGLGDIGRHFPDSEERWRGASSIELLKATLLVLESENYQAVNVDVSVVAERPRIAPKIEAMRTNLAAALGISADHVSVKGTTAEQLGALGRGEGIAVWAVALIDRIEEPEVVRGIDSD